jgi:hypothetical protein
LWEKTNESVYQKHVLFMNNIWGMIQRETIDLIVPWREKHLVPAGKGDTAFYPLSGADFINLYALFPASNSYLMVAMEQPGDADALRDYQSKRLIEGLAPIQRSIYLYGRNNYFQSKVMIKEMNNNCLPGTAPVLLIFMARLGLTVIDVENVTIDESGLIVSMPIKAGGNPSPKIAGIRINFAHGDSGEIRELVYLSMKLLPDSTSLSVPEGRFLNRLRDVHTLLKSAVYILHYKNYEQVRNFLLQRSFIIIQDDSGIPYSSFNVEWKISLYGVYRPYLGLAGCRPVMQYDLEKSYLENSLPLPFNFGYGILSGPKQSNLMIARKK